MTDIIPSLEPIQAYLKSCDHYDHKTIEGEVSLREFLAGMLSYYPSWIKTLYAIRWVFVRLLGMKQEGIPEALGLQPDDILFEPGGDATIFTVECAQEGQFWMAGASEQHLSAYLVVAVEPLSNSASRFHVGTIVHYNNWAGPIYFNVIRPFHHVVVRAMMQAGAAYRSSQEGLHYA